MRIAIATEHGSVAGHFGRCPQYSLIDIEDGQETGRTVVDNPGHEPGLIPRFLKSHDANAIIAGGMGQRAKDIFDSLGIETIIGVAGKIDEVITGCIDGTLEGGGSFCAHGEEHEHGHGGGHHDGMHHHGHH